MRKIVIAIDGFSATGKSSTAKQVADKLGYIYIDTGAMYRAVTFHFLAHHVELDNEEEVYKALRNCDVYLDEKNHVYLNGKQLLDKQLRNQTINQNVSKVATVSEVRKKMVAYQQQMGDKKGIVMDGRDIGTVVFPNAELKIFMVADMVVRARRRREELKTKGIAGSLEEIVENLKTRDHQDANREDSPLRKANDAIEIDTTNRTFQEQIDKIVGLANELIQMN